LQTTQPFQAGLNNSALRAVASQVGHSRFSFAFFESEFEELEASRMPTFPDKWLESHSGKLSTSESGLSAAMPGMGIARRAR
jgi:hypothetical protein